MPAPSRDIEIVVEQHDPLTERFFTGPNVLYRAEADDVLDFDFTGYTLRERCMLAALCSMKSGFKCNRKRIDRLAPELKRDALDTVLLGLRRKGHLRIVKSNGEGGRFVYRWRVSLRPVPEWAAAEAEQREQRQLAAGVAPAADEPLDDEPGDQADEPGDVSAGQAMGGKSGDGRPAGDTDEPGDVSAGHTMGGSSVDGSSVDGSTVSGSSTSGSSGDSKKDQGEENQGVKNTTTQDARDAASSSPPAEAGPVVVDKTPRFDDETRAMLAGAVEQAVGLKPRWKPDEVRTAMLAEIDRGITPALVADAVVRLAADPESRSPARLSAPGAWWNPPAPAEAEPIRYLDRSHRQCSKHRGNLAHNCTGCKADAIAEQVERARAAAERAEAEAAGEPVEQPAEPAKTMTAAEARAEAAAKIAAARARNGRTPDRRRHLAVVPDPEQSRTLVPAS